MGYGELWEDDRATRMIRTKEWKLIYYCTGNFFQLFHIKNDPDELVDLAGHPEYKEIQEYLTERLIENLYGQDKLLVKDGKLVGLPAKKYDFNASLADGNKLFQGRDMLLQRGIR